MSIETRVEAGVVHHESGAIAEQGLGAADVLVPIAARLDRLDGDCARASNHTAEGKVGPE